MPERQLASAAAGMPDRSRTSAEATTLAACLKNAPLAYVRLSWIDVTWLTGMREYHHFEESDADAGQQQPKNLRDQTALQVLLRDWGRLNLNHAEVSLLLQVRDKSVELCGLE